MFPIKKDYTFLVFTLIINTLFIAFWLKFLFPINFTNHNLFIAGLLGLEIFIPGWMHYFFNIANIFIIFWTVKKISGIRNANIAILIYALCPWSIYLTSAGSFYIYLLCIILMFTYSLLSVQSDVKVEKKSKVIFITTCFLGIVSSFNFILILAVFLIWAFATRIINFNQRWLLAHICSLFIIIIALYLINSSGFRNLASREITIFSDPGLKNGINTMQGESRENGFGVLSKLSENKYLYKFEYITNKFFKNITPATFFTPQEKLFGFSFLPPFYVALIVPFFYGLYILSKKDYGHLFVSLVLIIPSVLSLNQVDLNKLFLFSPVVIFLISIGLGKIIENKKKILLSAILISLFVQFFSIVSDVRYREFKRFEKHFDLKYEMKNR